MSKPWILLCPSSRGIGHALTRHLLRTTNLPILATTRTRDPEETKAALLKDLHHQSSFSGSASDRASSASATGPGVTGSSQFSDSSSSDTYPYPSPPEFSSDTASSTAGTPESSASASSSPSSPSSSSRSRNQSSLSDPLDRSSSSSSFQSPNHQSQSPSSSSASQANEEKDFSSRLHLLPLDVCHESSILSAAEHAASLFPPSTHHLHLAFALPGILHPEKSPQQVDYEHALDTYRVNCLGPLMLMKHFGNFLPRRQTEMDLSWHPVGLSSSSGISQELDDQEKHREKMRLPPHATWVNMSARVGSVSDNKSGGWYSYRSSKAAVNSLTKSFDHQLQSRSGGKAMCVGYHPGTVKTDLSKEFWDSVQNDKIWEPEEAVGHMARVVGGLGQEQRGRIWDWKGEEVLP